MDPDGRLYLAGAEKVHHDLKHNTQNPVPANEKSHGRHPLLTQLYFSTITSDDVIQLWALCREKDTCACYVVICIAVYIDKFEIPFHLSSHSFRVIRELLPDVLLERSSSPTDHFLNLGVRVAREGQCVGTAAS